MSVRQTIKKISPLQAIVFTGTISLLIVIAGTAGFLLTQSHLLDKVEKKQACYLDLVDFRGEVLEFSLICNLDPEVSREHQNALFFTLGKLLTEVREAGFKPPASMYAAKERWPGVLAGENIEVFMNELQKAIEMARIESKEASKQLVVINEFFLFFILSVLLTLSMTAGWLLHNNYRQTLVPLAQLAGQLKLLDRDIPESIHYTSEEIKKELIESDHSSDFTQITESIMSFCDEIELKNKKLDEIHIRDEKTNLYNYRHFKEHLILDVERARRLGDRVSLAMIDIDHFKRYNDAYGHIAGDYALKALADIISSQCRSYDLPSRFGGEEFALLFPKTDTATAHEIAERLRKIISASPLLPEDQQQPARALTVSIGIATFPDDGHDWQSLINNADRALYKAKSAGRNRVVSFSSMNSAERKAL